MRSVEWYDGWGGWSDKVAGDKPEPTHKCGDCDREEGEGWNGWCITSVEQLCLDCAGEEGTKHLTMASKRVHTARRDHADGLVLAGERYMREVVGGYEVGGPRWLVVRKAVMA